MSVMADKNNTPLKVTDVVLYKNQHYIIAKIINGAVCLQPLNRGEQFCVNPNQVEKAEGLQNENLAALFGKSIGDDIYQFMDFNFTDEP